MATVTLKLGDSLSWSNVYKDSAGTVIDITSYTINISAKENPLVATKLFNLSIGSGITLTDAVNGEYDVLVTDTTSYTVGDYKTDITYTNGSGVIVSSDTFTLKVIQDI